MPDDSQRAWLATLDPAVRLRAEAEIAFYDNEDLWEFEEVIDDDWEPDPESGIGLLVAFNAEELELIADGLGRKADLALLMKEMLLERVRASLTGDAVPVSETASAVT